MVTAVQVAVGDREQVPDLAVRVVDDRVEHRHLPQPPVVAAAGEGDVVHAFTPFAIWAAARCTALRMRG